MGKTFLIHHAISELLEEGVDPNRILYVAIDNPLFIDCSLLDLLQTFQTVTGSDWRRQRCYVFFDEIQYLKNWEQHLKSLHDSGTDTQFVVSGSAAGALSQGSKESGAGRFTDFLLPPLTFAEFIDLKQKNQLIDRDERGFFAADIGSLNRELLSYLNYGGYPEIANATELQADTTRFMRFEIIDKVLLRDLPSLYGVSDVRELHRLFTVLALNSGNELSLEDLSQKSHVGKATLRKYIDYLEAAFLIRVVTRVDQHAGRFQRDRQVKIYLTNPSLRTGLFSALTEDAPALGHLVETGVFAQNFHKQDSHLHYARWKSGKTIHELDLVSLTSGLIPLSATEVKFTDRVARQPGSWLPWLNFCQKNKLKNLTITTRTHEDLVEVDGVSIQFVPTAVYIYQSGLVEGP